MALILLIQLFYWFYGLKHSEIMQKKMKQFYYKTIVHFYKGCDVHMFFVEEIIETVSSIAKKVAKNEILNGYLNEIFDQ